MIKQSVQPPHLSSHQGTYGEGCNSVCTGTCQNGGSCHHITGKCVCPPGVQGENCEDGCPPGYFGEACDKFCLQQCATGYCNRIFGICECRAGWFGPSCNLPCPSFTWGSNCMQQCDCVTKNSKGCDPEVGKSGTLPCLVFILFIFLKSPSLGCSHVVVFCCCFSLSFFFFSRPKSGPLPCCCFLFLFFLFLKSPGLGCSHVFFFFSKAYIWAAPIFFFSFFFFFSKSKV